MHVYCNNLPLYEEFPLITEQLDEQPPQGAAGQVVELVVSSDTFFIEGFKYSQSASNFCYFRCMLYVCTVQEKVE